MLSIVLNTYISWYQTLPHFTGGGGAESFKRAAEKICYFRVDPKFKWGGVTFKDTMHSENSYSLYDNLYDG